jgi:hypothetical protein
MCRGITDVNARQHFAEAFRVFGLQHSEACNFTARSIAAQRQGASFIGGHPKFLQQFADSSLE